jgi:hypothetical protein
MDHARPDEHPFGTGTMGTMGLLSPNLKSIKMKSIKILSLIVPWLLFVSGNRAMMNIKKR